MLTCALLTAAPGGCASAPATPLPTRSALAASISDLRGGAATAAPLTVNAVALLALNNNLDLRAVRAQRPVAQAQVLQASLLPNPIVSGSALPLVAGQGNTFAWTAGITTDIQALVTLSARRRAAEAAARQVDAQVLWQEWQTLGQARLLAVRAIEGQRQLILLRRQRDLLSQRAAESRRAVAAGNATITVLAPDVAALQSARVQIDAAERTLLSTEDQLKALLGLSPAAILPLASHAELPAVDPAAALTSLPTLPDRRPDLIALQFGYASQNAKTRAAILARFPPLTFGITGGSDNYNTRNMGPQVTMSLPVFDRNQGNVAINRATQQQLHAEYVARLAAADGQVRSMLQSIAQLRDQLAAARVEQASTSSMARQAAAAFAAGNLDERGYVDLITTDLGKQQEILTLQQSLLEQEVAIDTLLGAGMPQVNLPLQEARE